MNRGVVVSDERSATLLSRVSEPAGRWRLEEQGHLENQHEDEHEHGRPSLLGRGTPTGPQHSVSEGHTSEEETRRFARELMAWLDGQRQAGSFDRVTVFAPPHFLGMLRAVQQGHQPVELREGELARTPLRELAAHPAIIAAIGAAREGAA